MTLKMLPSRAIPCAGARSMLWISTGVASTLAAKGLALSFSIFFGDQDLAVHSNTQVAPGATKRKGKTVREKQLLRQFPQEHVELVSWTAHAPGVAEEKPRDRMDAIEQSISAAGGCGACRGPAAGGCQTNRAGA